MSVSPLEQSFVNAWYERAGWLHLLRPVAWVFRLLAWSRRRRFRHLRAATLDPSAVPVIVVGNITVGGSGKTPLLMALASDLKRRGHRVGIVSRGYGGNAKQFPLRVDASTPASLCGDEPAMLARRLGIPVVVDPDRARAVGTLGSGSREPCDVILSDDGLQHYAMRRDMEIIVVDAERGFGNGLCLPAGPLREPLSRLREADFLVANGDDSRHRLPRQHAFIPMKLEAQAVVSLANGEHKSITEFFRRQMLHGVAGIGNPARFFSQLKQFGSQVIEHPFPDHFVYRAADLHFGDALPVVMTEKDAVKCREFSLRNAWFVQANAVLPDAFFHAVHEKLSALQAARHITIQRGLFDDGEHNDK